MKNSKRTIVVFALLLFTVIVTESFIKYNKSLYKAIFPIDVQGVGEVVDAQRFNTWIDFADPDVAVFVLPADSPNFLGDNPIAPSSIGVAHNLDFHRWAEQMFLWILSPAPNDGSYGNCGGLVLNSKEFYDYDEYNHVYKTHTCSTLPPDPSPLEKSANKNIDVVNSMTFGVKVPNKGGKNLPLLIEKETDKIFDVEKTPKSKSGFQLVFDANNNKIEVGAIKKQNNKPVFYDTKGAIIANPRLILSAGLDENTTVQQFVFKDETLTVSTIAGAVLFILPSQGQAQNENVLMARNGSLVYYNIMVNDVAAVFSTMVNKGVLPNTSKFPTTQAELDVIKAYAAANRFPLVNTNNRALAMEVKTSWVETINFTSTPPLANAINPPPYLGDYVTIQAYVPNYVQSSSTTWVVSTANPKRLARLALVGMHVVGSVKGHPEMIWSTFEHENNSPNNSFLCNKQNGVAVLIPNDIASKNWLFCNPTAPLLPLTNFNVSNILQIRDTDTIIAAPNHIISPSNTLRIKPFGWVGPINPAGDNPEIPVEGTSNARLVALKLDVDSNLLDGDVRKKYYQVGATWNSKIRSNGAHVGTTILSNSTMETTTQNTFSCFSCHESNPGQVNRNMPFFTPRLSHVFRGNLLP